ncbi:MAG: hypothetical protein IPL12_08200 [Bacteroidetes bacterium]|nr:hypothetical protein [Bacteroidota bacterium]
MMWYYYKELSISGKVTNGTPGVENARFIDAAGMEYFKLIRMPMEITL